MHALGLAAMAASAGAVPLTFEYTGVVSRIVETPGFYDPQQVWIGQSISGLVTFESTAGNVTPSPGVGTYGNPLGSNPLLDLSVQASIGGLSFQSANNSPANLITILNDYATNFGPVTDHLSINAGASPFNGWVNAMVQFDFVSTSPSGPLLSAALPTASLDMAAFDSNHRSFYLYAEAANQPGGVQVVGGTIEGTITSFTLRTPGGGGPPVPDPGATLLLLAGAGAAVGWMRRTLS